MTAPKATAPYERQEEKAMGAMETAAAFIERLHNAGAFKGWSDALIGQVVRDLALILVDAQRKGAPFQIWRVQVDGRIIPRLTGWREGDRIWLCVDNRFAQPFIDKEDAHGAAVLIAQAMAIAEGYPHMDADTKDMPFAPLGCAVELKP